MTDDQLKLCETAMCLWEATLWLIDDQIPDGKKEWDYGRALDRARTKHGWANLRMAVVQGVADCSDAWDTANENTEADLGCFDWDWCPSYLMEHFDPETLSWKP